MLQGINLEKKYGNFTALTQVSIEVAPGEAVLLLGRNGSGKSTLLSILATIVKPDAGQVMIDGMRGKSARRKIAYAPQDIVLFEELTVMENLYAWSSLKGAENVRRAKELVESLSMEEIAGKRVDRLSGGQRRRVNLAVALMGTYEYLLLDEPMAGIDEDGTGCIGALLKHERELGRGMIVAEHDPEGLLPYMDRTIKLEMGQIV
ncbi:MAG: ABC transporter ATP-binding protein [Lachnospiraceae bacterium]|nr:ABC transporter ATP-binding protein [Lachnospiraceae bacterium]